jgi:hypothetical protein
MPRYEKGPAAAVQQALPSSFFCADASCVLCRLVLQQHMLGVADLQLGPGVVHGCTFKSVVPLTDSVADLQVCT